MYGTHGTCKGNAESIERDGFNTSKIGLRGSGAYFWDYNDLALRARAIELAVCHWRQTFGNTEQKDANKCVVVDVSFSEDLVVVDCVGEHRNILLLYFEEAVIKLKHKQLDGKEYEEALKFVYDDFISRTEKQFGTIDLFRFSVEVSRKYFQKWRFPFAPTCAVVRNPKCIEKVDIIRKLDEPFKLT